MYITSWGGGVLYSAETGSHCYYASEEDPWSILSESISKGDTVHFPLEEGRVISFQSQHATRRMQYLFELLFRVLEGTIRWGILSIFLRYFPDRRKPTIGRKRIMPEQNHRVTRWSYMYRHLDENLSLGALRGPSSPRAI